MTPGVLSDEGARPVAGDMELAEAVAAVRDELLGAAARGAGSEVTFEVGPIEMEFTVELRREARARGGVRAFVVSADAETGASRTRTHRVSVVLQPRGAGGGPLLIAADDEGDANGLAAAGPL